MGLAKTGRTGSRALIAVLCLFVAIAAGPKNAAALTKVTIVEGPGFFTGTPGLLQRQTASSKNTAWR